MKKLLNTLYVTSETVILLWTGKMWCSWIRKRKPAAYRFTIWRESYPLATGAPVRADGSLCGKTDFPVLSDAAGEISGKGNGKVKGNVVLRQQQYAGSREEAIGLDIAKNCILGKVHNARWVLERAIRDHSMQIDTERVKESSEN